jgi:hypothetical protein
VTFIATLARICPISIARRVHDANMDVENNAPVLKDTFIRRPTAAGNFMKRMALVGVRDVTRRPLLHHTRTMRAMYATIDRYAKISARTEDK